MSASIKFIGVFALLLAIGFLTAGGCFDGDMEKYTFGGTTDSAFCYDDGDGLGVLDEEECEYKANFGGNVNACECGDLSFWDIIWGGWCEKCVESNILYHDKPAGIMLKAKATDVEDCTGYYRCMGSHPSICCVCDDLADQYACQGKDVDFMIAVKIKIKKQGPDGDYDHKWIKNAGVLCATDNGEGVGLDDYTPDFVAISLTKGYEDYANCGPVSGNVQEHECDYYEDIVW